MFSTKIIQINPWTKIELCVSKRNKISYRIVRFKTYLGKDGIWYYEPSPSNRTDEFIENTRYDSINDAFMDYIYMKSARVKQ